MSGSSYVGLPLAGRMEQAWCRTHDGRGPARLDFGPAKQDDRGRFSRRRGMPRKQTVVTTRLPSSARFVVLLPLQYAFGIQHLASAYSDDLGQ